MPIASMPRCKEFLQVLRTRLSEKKVTHCIFVAEYLASFSAAIGVDHDLAVSAGLLHDLCRQMGGESLILRAREYRLPLSEEQCAKPVLLHGPVAAEECRRELGITDEAHYEAIYWHTTGRPGLGPLGQGLYLADFAEPGRQYPEAAQVRERLRKHGFHEALRLCAETKLAFGAKKGAQHPDAFGFYHWLQKKDPAHERK